MQRLGRCWGYRRLGQNGCAGRKDFPDREEDFAD